METSLNFIENCPITDLDLLTLSLSGTCDLSSPQKVHPCTYLSRSLVDVIRYKSVHWCISFMRYGRPQKYGVDCLNRMTSLFLTPVDACPM